MENNLIAKKLNDTVSLYKVDKKHGGLRFYYGDYVDQITKILSEICPCGKVATLYFNSTYQELGKNFSSALKNAGFKPLSVIMPEEFKNSVDDLSRLFTLPEDVRAIITFDFSLNYAIKYFGAIKNVDVIHVLKEFNSADFISPVLFIKNGEQIDKVNLDCNQHVILDDNICQPDLPKIYAYTTSKIVNLIDYKVYGKLHSKRLSKASYEVLSTAIDNTLTCFKVSLENRKSHIVENMFLSEIANRMSGGHLWITSSEYSVKQLMPKFEGYDRIAFLKYTLNLYKKYFSGDYEHLLEIPDYNARANNISKTLKVDEKVFMQTLLAQINNYNNSKNNLNQLKKTLNEQVVKTEKLVGQINSTYHALGGGGKENKHLKFCVYHSGDLNDTLNGMSLIRESGILEFIEV